VIAIQDRAMPNSSPIHQILDEWLPARCVLALSGGRDSMVLLHLLRSKKAAPLVAHFNHRWHPREDAHAEHCAVLAQEAGLEFVCGTSREEGPCSEGRAREERYTFLLALARSRGLPLLTAHTAEDQAETVLMSLLRGAGTRGLAGIQPVVMRDGVQLLRPLLQIRRQEITSYARRHKLDWIEDPSNKDTSRLRSWMRHRAIPYLTKGSGRDAVTVLCRAGDILGAEDRFLSQLAESAMVSCRQDDSLLTRALLTLDPVLRYRVLHRWLEERGVTRISAKLLHEAASLLEKNKPAKINLPGELWLRRAQGKLWIDKKRDGRKEELC